MGKNCQNGARNNWFFRVMIKRKIPKQEKTCPCKDKKTTIVSTPQLLYTTNFHYFGPLPKLHILDNMILFFQLLTYIISFLICWFNISYHIIKIVYGNKLILIFDMFYRFYVAEVVVALEYLHMLGIVYRDLKPENVLVRSDGHIMLTDFDLSLKCDLSMSTPAQVFPNPSALKPSLLPSQYSLDPPKFTATSCILPNCIVPSVSCFNPKRKRNKKPTNHGGPEFVAEPVDIRSMSFVGTHEYLAPEIVSGEGHGSAVDWWTLGIFVFELFYGVTPFKGVDNELTLANIVARALEFPKEPVIPTMARDLISQLLVKDPERRLGSKMGASAIKHHPFFNGVNWALLRCTSPPFVPPPFIHKEVAVDDGPPSTPVEYY